MAGIAEALTKNTVSCEALLGSPLFSALCKQLWTAASAGSDGVLLALLHTFRALRLVNAFLQNSLQFNSFWFKSYCLSLSQALSLLVSFANGIAGFRVWVWGPVILLLHAQRVIQEPNLYVMTA